MPLMERVREIGAQQSEPEESSVGFARQSLNREIARSARSSRTGRSRTRRWAGISIGGLAGATAAAALVLGNVFVPPAAEPASAAEVFEEAALAVEARDETLAAGQYLRIETSAEWLTLWDVDMPDVASRFNNGNPADAEAAWMSRDTTVLYVPADRSQEWVRVQEPAEIGETYGARVQEAIAERARSGVGSHDEGQIERALGGVVSGPGANGETVHDYSWGVSENVAGLSTDPEQLLAELRVMFGAESAGDSTADSSIVESLVDGDTMLLADPELRAASLRVLGLLPGSVVERVEGDLTTIRFTWSTQWWTAQKDITVDTVRGYVVNVASSTEVAGAEPSLAGLPVWQSTTSFDVAVVDAAP